MKAKNLITTLLLAATTIVSFMGNTITAKAEMGRFGDPSDTAHYIEYNPDNGKTYYINNDGDFIYKTNDKERTSSIHYRTEGFTFSRIKKDVVPTGEKESNYYHTGDEKKENRQYVTIPLVDGKNGVVENPNNKDHVPYRYTYKGTPYQTNEWKIPWSTLYTAIKGESEEWAAEIDEKLSNNEPVYIGVDGVLLVCNHKSSDPKTHNFDQIKGEWAEYDYGSGITNGGDWHKMAKKYGFRESSLMTHFNIFLNLNPDATNPEDEEVAGANRTPPDNGSVNDDISEDTYTFVKRKDITPSNPTPSNPSNPSNPSDPSNPTGNTKDNPNKGKSGAMYSAPRTYTYNDDDEFEIGIAIPASEDFTNTVEIDPWYGLFKIKRVEVSRTYKFSISYSYETTNYKWDREIHDWVVDEDNPTKTVYDSYPDERVLTAEYYEILDLDLFELTNQDGGVSATVSYKSDSGVPFNNNVMAKYTNSATVPYTVRYNGYSWGTGDDRSQAQMSSNPNYSHYIYPNINTGGSVGHYNSEGEARSAAAAEVNNRMAGQQIVTSNDLLSINGVNYLDENGICNDGTLASNKANIIAQSKHASGFEIEQGVDDTIIASQTVVIPETQKNDDYYSTLTTKYKGFVFNKGIQTLTISDHEGYEAAIKAGHEDEEPIRVQTPVMSPISIDDSGSTYQAGDSEYDVLNLDGSYKVKFEFTDFFEKKYPGYDDPAGLTKYIKQKEVRFPFTVQLKDASGETKIFEPTGSDGYTEWIALDNDGSTASFNIYIPSWAKEGTYEPGIQVRVYANNYIPDSQSAENYEINEVPRLSGVDYKDFYVATYNLPVSMQGVMYGFEITGINDITTFGSANGTYENGIYSFVTAKQDKKVGTYNRFNVNANSSNHTYLRTQLWQPWDNVYPTGTTTWGLINTLPLTDGKSNSNSASGTLALGSKFGFSLKTISNLNTSGTNGNIDINASYRYVSADGSNTTKNIALFYNESSSNVLVPFENTSRQSNKTVKMTDGYFEDSYSPEYLSFTATKKGSTKQGVLNTANKNAYNTKNMNIPYANMLFSGDELELAINEKNDYGNAKRYNSDLVSLSTSQQNAFNASMQTWFGEYSIPSSTRIMDVDKFKAECDSKGVTSEAISKYRTTADRVTIEQLLAVYGQDGITGKEDFWLKDGYLVLNFDITALNGSSKWLSYYKDYDMWCGEAGAWNTSDHSRTATVVDDNNRKINIKVYSGDVAIIDLTAGNNYTDRYGAEVLYID